MMLLVCILLFFTVTISAQDTTKRVGELTVRKLVDIEINKLQGKVITTYDTDGHPVFQSQIAKGFHRVTGEVTLVSGKASVTFNNSPLTGIQDVSFQDSTSYRGHAWSLDTTNTNTYRLYPVSGTRCIILSSDGADAGTVRFVAEGD